MAVITLTDPANNGTEVKVTNVKLDSEPNHEHFTLFGDFAAPVVVTTRAIRLVKLIVSTGTAGRSIFLKTTRPDGTTDTFAVIVVDPTAGEFAVEHNFNMELPLGIFVDKSGALAASFSADLVFDTVATN